MPLTDAQRRAKGQWRLVCWLPREYQRKVEQLCEWSGFARDDLLMGLIDGELDARRLLGGKR